MWPNDNRNISRQLSNGDEQCPPRVRCYGKGKTFTFTFFNVRIFLYIYWYKKIEIRLLYVKNTFSRKFAFIRLLHGHIRSFTNFCYCCFKYCYLAQSIQWSIIQLDNVMIILYQQSPQCQFWCDRMRWVIPRGTFFWLIRSCINQSTFDLFLTSTVAILVRAGTFREKMNMSISVP